MQEIQVIYKTRTSGNGKYNKKVIIKANSYKCIPSRELYNVEIPKHKYDLKTEVRTRKHNIDGIRYH